MARKLRNSIICVAFTHVILLVLWNEDILPSKHILVSRLYFSSTDENTVSNKVNTVGENDLSIGHTSEITNRECSVPRNGYNVLFIIVDDLRATPATYSRYNNHQSARPITPHLDRLAARSLELTEAYTQYALCGPSRASMLTSRRPDTTGVYNNKKYWRESGGNFTTLPQYFQKNGYTSVGLGKIFHPRTSSNNHDPYSWSEPHAMPSYVDIFLYNSVGCKEKFLLTAYKPITKKDRKKVPLLVDEITLKKFRERLPGLAQDFRQKKKKFFVGFGISRPHTNLLCPAESFEKYTLEDDDQYLADRDWQTPVIRRSCRVAGAANTSGDSRIPDQTVREFRRAYFACISHMDDIVGGVIEELKRNDLQDTTIISFVSDHGISYGENDHFGKETTYSSSTHVPMMVYIPGCTDRGITSSTIVENIDLYPTLVEAAGLPPLPKCPKDSHSVTDCVEGTSLLPLVAGEYRRLSGTALSQLSYDHHRATAYSIRTNRFRLTMSYDVKRSTWKDEDETTQLFDLNTDPFESVNVANKPEYKTIRNDLMKALHSKVETTVRVDA